MTNLSNSSPKKPTKLIIIHGLNNNVAAFLPMMGEFKKSGWETHFVTLPCHGEIRKEARDFKEAFACFDEGLKKLAADGPYAVIAFSQGALYMQLWLEKRPDQRPVAQVLLAPALFIRRFKIFNTLSMLLPSFFMIKSLTPKHLRMYSSLSVSEYRILMHGISAYERIKHEFKVPTLVMIDPKDELVDAGKVSSLNVRIEHVHRDYLKKGVDGHHIIFHPEYFTDEDWKKFIGKIDHFLKAGFKERSY